MRGRITEKTIKSLAKPLRGSKITYDNEVKGFGFRIASTDSASFILNYRINGRERRITIGQYPVWSVSQAREQASKLRLMIDNGIDPLAERTEKREAWTVRDLSEEYQRVHVPNLSSVAQKDVGVMWANHILPFLGSKKLNDLTAKDIDELHRRISVKTPIRANRILEVFRHSRNLAIRWGHIERNPANGFKRNVEQPKEHYLNATELERLLEALKRHPNQQAANAIRMLIYTGARRGEVLKADWSQFDLEAGIWTKPSSHTKQRRVHRVPLSDAALTVLHAMKAEATGLYLFPNQYGKPNCSLERPWEDLQSMAGLK
jgi:integrase